MDGLQFIDWCGLLLMLLSYGGTQVQQGTFCSSAVHWLEEAHRKRKRTCQVELSPCGWKSLASFHCNAQRPTKGCFYTYWSPNRRHLRLKSSHFGVYNWRNWVLRKTGHCFAWSSWEFASESGKRTESGQFFGLSSGVRAAWCYLGEPLVNASYAKRYVHFSADAKRDHWHYG